METVKDGFEKEWTEGNFPGWPVCVQCVRSACSLTLPFASLSQQAFVYFSFWHSVCLRSIAVVLLPKDSRCVELLRVREWLLLNQNLKV